MPLHYLAGDATRPQGDGPQIIVHCCNDSGGWGKGFVVAISQRWKEPEAAFRAWHAGSTEQPFELGEVQFVAVEDNLWVANVIGQHGTRSRAGQPPIRYEAIKTGLHRVAAFAVEQNASVHMPRIGCGLAGGEWQTIEKIIEQTLLNQDIAVTVYDFEPA